MTLPLAISKLANSVRVPCRTYSLVQLRGLAARNGSIGCVRSLDASSAGGAAVFALAAAFDSLATALAFAGVFAFAAVITGIATALSFTIVLTFASVLAFIEVNQVVEGGTHYGGNTSSVGAHSEGSGQRPATAAPAMTALEVFIVCLPFLHLGSWWSLSRLQIRYESCLFIPLHAVCSWPSADQLSIDVFGHDRFELLFAPRQPRHNRADWYLESFGNLFVRKLAQVKELHWGSVLNVDSQKSIQDDSRIQGLPRHRFPCRPIL